MTTTSRPRGRAYTENEFREALGLDHGQWCRAVAAGLIPDQDRKTPRWSAALVHAFLPGASELAASIPDDLGPDQMMQLLGLDYGQWCRARESGLIPAPDRPPYWTRPLADQLAAQTDLRERIPLPNLGANRLAELLTERTGLPVGRADVEELARLGMAQVAGEHKDWPIYDTEDLVARLADPDQLAVLALVVSERRAWLADSMPLQEAAESLGWDRSELARVCKERGISPGRFARYALTDVAGLAGDLEVMEEVRRQRLLGADQAARHLEIRRRDWDYIVAAGWVRPVTTTEIEITRRLSIEVPLYQLGETEDVLTIPGIDWDEVRAVRPGEPSPLREFTRLPASRAQIIRAWCRELGAAWSVEVWPHWRLSDGWTVDWELREDGHPTVAEVREALCAHEGAGQYAGEIRLSSEVGEIIRWARECQQPDTAVILDTETTGLDGVIVEVAVIDACTGRVLVDTLVNPGGVEIEPGARAVHGITDAELAAAPPWREVAPAVLAAIKGRRVLAYNASFDHARLRDTHAAAGLDPAELPGADTWQCLMEARSTWRRISRWLPLGGGHRALGDARAGHRLLVAMGSPPR